MGEKSSPGKIAALYDRLCESKKTTRSQGEENSKCNDAKRKHNVKEDQQINVELNRFKMKNQTGGVGIRIWSRTHFVCVYLQSDCVFIHRVIACLFTAWSCVYLE